MNAHALETLYNGIRFRSRLEARWAVFMDTLGVRYDYEPEGYHLDGVNYLPDFWVPVVDAFLEIKPTSPTPEENDKAMRLAKFSGKRVYIFIGSPHPPWIDGSESAHVWFNEVGWDSTQWWCQCPRCMKAGIQFEGRSDRIKCSCDKPGDDGHNYDTVALVRAYDAAKAFRFEF